MEWNEWNGRMDNGMEGIVEWNGWNGGMEWMEWMDPEEWMDQLEGTRSPEKGKKIVSDYSGTNTNPIMWWLAGNLLFKVDPARAVHRIQAFDRWYSSELW